jgi:membrane protein DedA with SNARE-associated domain
MDHMNYLTVYLLMTIESTFIPLPSEAVVPPAAWKAAQGGMNVFLLGLAATAGAVTGAMINYTLSITLGRTVIYGLARTKLARLLLVREEEIRRAEAYFNKNGAVSTFIGRLIPVIRHLISIPAGLARMNLKTFLLFTALGAAIWNVVLILLGVFLYSQKDLLQKYFKEISNVLLVLGALFFVYLIVKGIIDSRRKKTKSEQKDR